MSWNWVSLTWPGWHSTRTGQPGSGHMPTLAGDGRCKLHPNHPQRKTQREKEGWTINVSISPVPTCSAPYPGDLYQPGPHPRVLGRGSLRSTETQMRLGVLLAVVKGAALDTPRGSLYFWYFLFWMTLGSSRQILLKSHWDLIRVALALWVNWGELTFYVLFLTLKRVISSLYWRLL